MSGGRWGSSSGAWSRMRDGWWNPGRVAVALVALATLVSAAWLVRAGREAPSTSEDESGAVGASVRGDPGTGEDEESATVGPGGATSEPGPAAGAGVGDDAPGRLPVVLVPGWLDTDRDLAALRLRLLSSGWSPDAVVAIGFDEPTGSSRTHARELSGAVDDVLERTGADEIDIVAHSMGGLATRWYLLTTPNAPVRRVAFLASPHQGTLSAHLAWGDGRDEMMPGSGFLDSLNASAPKPEGVEAITIRTSVDTHIVPGENAMLPGTPDYRLCCPTHAGLLRDEEAFAIVLDFLTREVVGEGAAEPRPERPR